MGRGFGAYLSGRRLGTVPLRPSWRAYAARGELSCRNRLVRHAALFAERLCLLVPVTNYFYPIIPRRLGFVLHTTKESQAPNYGTCDSLVDPEGLEPRNAVARTRPEGRLAPQGGPVPLIARP